MNEPKFEWLPEERIAFCTLVDPITHREYVGTASCHEDDIDMCNEKTGCEIALRRAAIEAYKTLRDETKAALGALKQLFYSMNMSKIKVHQLLFHHFLLSHFPQLFYLCQFFSFFS